MATTEHTRRIRAAVLRGILAAHIAQAHDQHDDQAVAADAAAAAVLALLASTDEAAQSVRDHVRELVTSACRYCGSPIQYAGDDRWSHEDLRDPEGLYERCDRDALRNDLWDRLANYCDAAIHAHRGWRLQDYGVAQEEARARMVLARTVRDQLRASLVATP